MHFLAFNKYTIKHFATYLFKDRKFIQIDYFVDILITLKFKQNLIFSSVTFCIFWFSKKTCQSQRNTKRCRFQHSDMPIPFSKFIKLKKIKMKILCAEAVLLLSNHFILFIFFLYFPNEFAKTTKMAVSCGFSNSFYSKNIYHALDILFNRYNLIFLTMIKLFLFPLTENINFKLAFIYYLVREVDINIILNLFLFHFYSDLTNKKQQR